MFKGADEPDVETSGAVPTGPAAEHDPTEPKGGSLSEAGNVSFVSRRHAPSIA